MTCKDCIHYEVCEGWQVDERGESLANGCADFKDKSKCIELPCKVGDTVYRIDDKKYVSYGIDELTVSRIEISKLYGTVFYCDCDFSVLGATFNLCDYGKTVFLTKSEAEQKLKELKENA